MDELNKIIDKYTEGNYLFSKTAKEEMAKDIFALFSVSQQRELLLDYEIYNASEDDKKNNMKYLESLVDTYLSNNCG